MYVNKQNQSVCTDYHILCPQVYKFEENYAQALEGFSHASLLDPGWREPLIQEQRLLTYLSSVAEMVEEKVSFHTFTIHCKCNNSGLFGRNLNFDKA
ncbi:hypothetical protein DPMN_174073 [Dreissena polymorpha]|uniref:Uncharacterized protein n=1 Tax=Dreissena polymorpha TaxID=45954 RepID=A0A9D4IGS4_DREPO|nr:hypothetical protein DPMN_174073 [Dreissena polymorpha]